MIIKLILLIIFNLTYTLNNYNGVFNLIIMNTILFCIEFFIIKPKIKLNYKSIIISSLITLLLIIINKDIFIYGYKNQDITITNLQNKPVLINSLYLDNIKQKLNSVNVNNSNAYDIYNKLTSNYTFSLIGDYQITTSKNKKVLLNFEKDDSSYKVSINGKIIEVPSSTVNRNQTYYKAYDNYYSYYFDNINYQNRNVIINFIASFLGLNIIIMAIIQNIKNKKWLAIYLSCTLFSFEFNNLILPSIPYKILLFVFIAITGYFINKLELKENNIKQNIITLISSLIVTFLFIGNLYLDTHITISNIFTFILFSGWIYFIILLIKSNFINLKNKLISENSFKFVDLIILFIIPLTIFLIYLYFFSPYIITTDGYMQLGQIRDGIFNNWHPFVHTLLIDFIYKVFGNFQAFIITRILFTSLMISFIGTYFIKKGIKRKIIYILICLFCLNPVTGIYMISFLKDVDFIIFLTLLTFLLIKYIDRNFSLIDYFLLFISLLAIALFRHNGIYITIIIALILSIIFLKQKNFKLFIIPIMTIILVFIINTILYRKLSVLEGLRNVDIAPLVHGLQAIEVSKPNEDIEKLFSEFITIDELKDSYSKYNIDTLLHYNSTPFRNVEINKKDVYKLYFENILKHPIILLRDRLYGTNIMWNIFKSDNINTYDYQYYEDEFGFEYYSTYKIKLKDNFFKKIIIKILIFISNHKILNALFLRSGIYLCILLITLLNFYKKQNLFILLPMLLNCLTLFIAMHYQAYRYVMFIPIIAIVYFLQIVSDRKQH